VHSPMAYSWCNKPLLDTLSVEGADNVLNFSSPREEAQVFLDGDDIGRVIFSLDGKKTMEIARSKAHAIVVGEGNAQRDVYHYLLPGGPAPTMRLGIEVSGHGPACRMISSWIPRPVLKKSFSISRRAKPRAAFRWAAVSGMTTAASTRYGRLPTDSSVPFPWDIIRWPENPACRFPMCGRIWPNIRAGKK
jgi:hypothetical protein